MVEYFDTGLFWNVILKTFYIWFTKRELKLKILYKLKK